MIHVSYKTKGVDRTKKTFFSDYKEFTVWMIKQYENIQIKKMVYGGKE